MRPKPRVDTKQVADAGPMIYATREDGDAVNPDGTLKDASAMTWLFSPSDDNPPAIPAVDANPGVKRKSVANSDDKESEEEGPQKKKQKEAGEPEADDTGNPAVETVRQNKWRDLLTLYFTGKSKRNRPWKQGRKQWFRA